MNPNANESYRIDWEERNNKSMKWIFHSDSTILLSQCTAKQPKGGAKDLGKNFLSSTF